jgi:hypothetical protein
MQQFKNAQTAYAQQPYNVYNRPTFQQPYGRSNGPVWSNIEPIYYGPQSTYQEPIREDVYPLPQQHNPYPNAHDPLPPFMKQRIKEQKQERGSKQNSDSRTPLGVVESLQNQWMSLFYKNWMKEELYFSMNKISLAGLFFGLMFLGSIFFLIGFLVAVNLYGNKPSPSVQIQQRSVMPTQGAMLSGRTNQMTDATTYPAGMAAQPMPQNGSLANAGRLPSSMQGQGIISSSLSKGRVPSFQMNVAAPNAMAR